MSDSEAVRRLLSGEIDPKEINDDPALYAMAERIYGALALEELGVSAPKIGVTDISHPIGVIPSDITLPEFNPEISDSKTEERVRGGKFRFFATLAGITGFIGVIFNMTIGVGSVLCSTGLANMREVCQDDYGQTKLVFSKGFTYERMHEVDSWVKPMTEPLIIDVAFLGFFLMMIIIGLLVKRKSVHSADVVPLTS